MMMLAPKRTIQQLSNWNGPIAMQGAAITPVAFQVVPKRTIPQLSNCNGPIAV